MEMQHSFQDVHLKLLNIRLAHYRMLQRTEQSNSNRFLYVYVYMCIYFKFSVHLKYQLFVTHILRNPPKIFF
jgi:hypothetical protein